MTMYQAIICANAIAKDKIKINYLVLNNLIGDCFRALKMGRELNIKLADPFIELIIDKWLHYKNMTDTIIKTVYFSTKKIFNNNTIEMD